LKKGQIHLLLKKIISDENDYRAEYMKNDENLPEVEYSKDEIKLELEAEEIKKFEKEENGNQISEYLLYQ